MANENTNITLNTGTAKLRASLSARNLYTPYQEYPIQNQKTVDKVVAGINTVIKGITPFSSYDLTNTVYSRLITTKTPLTEIGLAMLGKQFALNSMSSLAQTKFPTIKPSNLWDGSKDTKLFTLKENFSITRKEGNSKFKNFINDVIYHYPTKNYPFTKESNNDDYIKNTGTGQLNLLYAMLNKNFYKQNDSTLFEYSLPEHADKKLRDAFVTLTTIKGKYNGFFNFSDGKFDPYSVMNSNIIGRGNAQYDANETQYWSLSYSQADGAYGNEYAPNKTYVEEYLGDTNKTPKNNKDDLFIPDSNTWIDKNNEFSGDEIENKIIWGFTDVSSDAASTLTPLAPGISDEIYNSDIEQNDTFKRFNIKTGLLEYTKNLLNASNGQIIAITKKAFTNGDDKIVGFQGSALWQSNDEVYATKNGTANKKGLRQHTQLDPYNKFTKAIRFNGNEVYGGNPDSVIYNSVLPKIHPTMNKKNEVDSDNMMFSIENLAVKVFGSDDIGMKRDSVGIVDDDYGNEIPMCEVGPSNGRIMWFPPYNLEINETASAKYEPTVMIGRSEPMYNYMNSERTATVRFSLIVDYPEQLKNYKGVDKQRLISEFFAFGGSPYKKTGNDSISELELNVDWIKQKIKKDEGKTEIIEPKVIIPTPLFMFFPNDVPKVNDNLNTIVNDMFDKYSYEIDERVISSDGTTFNLNENIYHISGMIKYQKNGIDYYSTTGFVEQYNVSGIENQEDFGQIHLNWILKDFYENENVRRLYNIEITGSASKLYTEHNLLDVKEEIIYNKALGIRRANSYKELIDGRLKAIFGKNASELGIKFVIKTAGSAAASISGATAAAIPLKDTKMERTAVMRFVRNKVVPEPKKVLLSDEDKKNKDRWLLEISGKEKEISDLKNLPADCVLNERTAGNEDGAGDTGILHGFQSVAGNYYYPAFHSQTPEDFHKRLTFLQQCTRQGSAKKYELIDEEGNLRAKNSVFGRQPICILRVGDFFNTKIILESVTIDYAETTWDMNPEGFGMQPMIANVTLNMKLIGGQSLKGPIAALQNAATYNYYANSSYTNEGRYKLPSKMADDQNEYNKGKKTADVTAAFNRYKEYKDNLDKNVKHKE